MLARVGDQVITVDDFKAELQYRTANRQPLLERQALLAEMITRLTLVQRAKAAGLDQAADVRHTYEEMLIARLKEKELAPQLAAAKVSPEEINAAYAQDAAQFTQPAKAHLAILFLAADPKLGTNQLAGIAARAQAARQQALALPATVKGFGPVAASSSEDQITRYRGGDAGWFSTSEQAQQRWPAAVIAAGLALPNIGDLSEVIRERGGFYLVRKMDARPPVVMPLAQAQGLIERRLLAAKRARIEAAFSESLAASGVVTNLELLSQVDYPTQTIRNIASRPPSLPGSP